MATFMVSWVMEIEADDAVAAAVHARETLMDPDNIASVFDVRNVETNEETEVDALFLA